MTRPILLLVMLLGSGAARATAQSRTPSLYAAYGTFKYDADSDRGNPLWSAGASWRLGRNFSLGVQLDYANVGIGSATRIRPRPGHEQYYHALAVLESSLATRRHSGAGPARSQLFFRTGAGIGVSTNRGEFVPDASFSDSVPPHTWGPAGLIGLGATVRLNPVIAVRGTADFTYEKLLGSHLRNWSATIGLAFR